MQVDEPTAGEWYHTVSCSKCGAAVHAFHARSGSDERLPGPGLYQVRCAHCGYPDLYKPNAFIPCKVGTTPAEPQPRAPVPEARFRRRSGIDRRQAGVRPSLSATRADARRVQSH